MAATDHLTAEQLAWLVEDEKLWRQAHHIAGQHPGVDPGGIYRVLRNLQPPQREAAGSTRSWPTISPRSRRVNVRLQLARVIASKRASGRPKDLAALDALEEALAVARSEG